MSKILFTVLTALAFTFTAQAQDEGMMSDDSGMSDAGMAKKVPPFAIYGDFTSSMFWFGNGNAGNPEGSAAGTQPENNSRHGDFMVDLVEINLQKTWSASKLHLGIGYGPSVQAVNATDSGLLNVTSAYYEMESPYGLNFKVGKFRSGMGYEDYVHMNNMQFTRSHAYYALAPQIVTGAGVSYDFENMLNVGAYIANNATNTQPNQFGGLNSYALQVNVKPTEMIAVDVNYMAGTDFQMAQTTFLPSNGVVGAGTGIQNGKLEYNIIDVAAAIKVNEMFDAALTYMSKTAKTLDANDAFNFGRGTDTEVTASSLGIYGNLNFGAYSAGLRYEMVDDDGGLVAGTAENTINAITVGLHAEIDQNTRVTFEYRNDSSDKKIFTSDSGGTGAIEGEDTQDIYGFGLQYRF